MTDSPWNRAARVFFLLATLGAVTSPPVASIAGGLGILAFLCGPHAWLRLRAALGRPLGRGILVLLLVLALATTWAQTPWATRFAAWWSWRPLLLLLVGSALFDEPRVRDTYARWLVAALAVAAIGSFVLLMLPDPTFHDEPGILLRNHTTQGMAFVVGAALAAMLLWGRPATARARWLLGGAILLFCANIATVTSGRSAHVALLVAAAIGAFSLLRGRRRWQALLLIPVVGAGLLAASPLVRMRFEKAMGELDTATTAQEITPMGIRIIIWRTTREMIAERPLLGFGVGGFVPPYRERIHRHEMPESINWVSAERATDTHNQYLRLLVEAGVLGLGAFLVFVAGALRQPAPPPYRGFGIALLCAWLATSLLNSHFQAFCEAHLIGLVLGVLLASDETPYAWIKADVTAASTSS